MENALFTQPWKLLPLVVGLVTVYVCVSVCASVTASGCALACAHACMCVLHTAALGVPVHLNSVGVEVGVGNARCVWGAGISLVPSPSS